MSGERGLSTRFFLAAAAAAIVAAAAIFLAKLPAFFADPDEVQYADLIFFAFCAEATGWHLRNPTFAALLSVPFLAIDSLFELDRVDTIRVMQWLHLAFNALVALLCALQLRVLCGAPAAIVFLGALYSAPIWMLSSSRILTDAPSGLVALLALLMLCRDSPASGRVLTASAIMAFAFVIKFEAILFFPAFILAAWLALSGTGFRKRLLIAGSPVILAALWIMVTDWLRWGTPGTSISNYVIFNFIERRWAAWFNWPAGPEARWRAFLGNHGEWQLWLAALGALSVLLPRNRRYWPLLLAVATTVPARFAMEYFTQRSWIISIPLVAVFPALWPSVLGRIANVISPILAGVLILGCWVVPQRVALHMGDAEVEKDAALLEAGASFAGSFAGSPVRISLSPVVLPELFFKGLYYNQLYSDQDLTRLLNSISGAALILANQSWQPAEPLRPRLAPGTHYELAQAQVWGFREIPANHLQVVPGTEKLGAWCHEPAVPGRTDQ